MFSSSKIILDGLIQPRADLFTATMNAHTGQIVGEPSKVTTRREQSCYITLFWINNQGKPVKQWTENRVTEIKRYTQASEWMFVHSQDMIVDLGTPNINVLKLVNQDSTGINEFSWMKTTRYFPAKIIDEIRLNEEEIVAIQNENLLKYSSKVREEEHQNTSLAAQAENGLSS